MNRISKAKSLMLVSESGVGKVNAALASQMLIDLFRIDAIIFSGVAKVKRLSGGMGSV